MEHTSKYPVQSEQSIDSSMIKYSPKILKMILMIGLTKLRSFKAT